MQAIQDYFSDINFIELLIKVGLKLFVALLIFQVGRWIASGIQKVLEKLMRRRAMDEVPVDFIGSITFFAILIVAVVAALDYVGVPATSLVAVMGAAGLAIGLALKDSLANFAAGFMLVMFRPFTKGDYVDAGGESGTVDEVSLVSTRLLTPDNRLINVPNSAVWNNSITNYSANATRRVDMTIGVAYDDDLKVVAGVLKKVCAEHTLVLDAPATSIFVAELGDSSVNFAVRPWVKTEDYWTVRAEVTENAKAMLEEAGCSIPFPQRDIHQYVYHPAEAGEH
jgi:small conductance mechanosensitive channel